MNSTALRIDGHAHVFHRGLAPVAGRRYTPDYDAPLDLYLRRLDDAGITHGVLVQPSFLGTDNAYLIESLQAAGGRLRGIVVVDPSISRMELEALDRVGVVGIRLNLVGQPLPDLAAPDWRALVAAVIALGWQIEIQRAAADLVPLARRLVEAGATVVVDHFGLPDPSLGIDDPGFRALLDLASAGRVHVKLSAPYRSGPDGRTSARRAYPLLRDAFGLDRLMWGSDWPHTRHEAIETYAANRDFLDTLVPDEAERRRILAAPRALFRF